MSTRYLVTVDEQLDKMLDLVEGMGEKKAQKIINIVRSWMAEKSMISTKAKKNM